MNVASIVVVFPPITYVFCLEIVTVGRILTLVSTPFTYTSPRYDIWTSTSSVYSDLVKTPPTHR